MYRPDSLASIKVLALVLCIKCISAYSSIPWQRKFGSISSMLSNIDLNSKVNPDIEDIDISLGAPRSRPVSGSYVSPASVTVERIVEPVSDVAAEIQRLVYSLDDNKGVILTSSYEFPGRYARWTVGFVAPPLIIEGRNLDFSITALNKRGEVLLEAIRDHLALSPELFNINPSINNLGLLTGNVIPSNAYFAEEDRSKQPTLFSLIRAVRDMFFSKEPEQLGLFGSFGYDLTFQFGEIDCIEMICAC
jgi:anthranilate synthase